MKPLRLFLVLIPVYLFFLLFLPNSSPDETRFMNYAENLTRGCYSSSQQPDIWFGPGYPALLAPFVAMGSPPWIFEFLNLMLLLAGVLYIYKTLQHLISPDRARWAAVLFGAYPPLAYQVSLTTYEIFAVFLVCAFTFHLSAAFQSSPRRGPHLILAALSLAWLALTKVIVGYAVAAVLVILFIIWILKRSTGIKKAATIFTLALVICVPYLIYTYSLTGIPFFWANSGGLSLYWMTTPYAGELGDWHHPNSGSWNARLEENHGAFFRSISTLSPVEKDRALTNRALENLQTHPGKYVTNWLANTGRLLFNYPYSYTPQKLSTYFYIIPSLLLWCIAGIAAWRRYRSRRRAPPELTVLMLFTLILFGGHSLLSSYYRHSLICLPVFALLATWAIWPGGETRSPTS